MQTAFKRGGRAYQLLKRHAPYRDQVVFELTQGMKMKDFEFIKKGIGILRKFGFRFAIDDVGGIGARFLKMLSLKPDFIKLDMRLVQGISKNPLHQTIVRQLISIANKNRALMIAEGIEQKKDLDYIRKMGIRYVQGFYFSKPKKKMQVTLSRR